ncbi:DUF6624 domain-containing protein [Frigoriglobus tundricola]|uniref:Uncharacterized protein n=1 Tax=Frigoriglobus tundricola TaxID=2774151 RepID=A0A6M5YZX4_9BACT|nr:DUF6624 domain-containing protein [Frigoriglobus tundricola]QJW99006.1 hypothetical protein FTUN_6602 [Frigoriglobus tundricola]
MLSTLAFVLAVGTADGKDPAPIKNPKLREELLARVEKEQAARHRIIEANAAGKKLNPTEFAQVLGLDKDNREWLKGVVEKHGWPGKSLVGEDGAHAAWLLVQHADPDLPFQKKCLDLMKAVVKAGEVEKKDLAYLTDRVLSNEGKKQLYGTQLVQADGRMVPKPIEDEDKVDERRKEVGLQSLAEYLKIATEAYKPKKP